MEFPDIGTHCSKASCKKFDFLPIKCDSCAKVFCSSHFSYDRHECPIGQRKQFHVPICPLCDEPVPTPPDVEPDITVGRHIDQDCKSERRKIFVNCCSFKNCKRKELIPVTCSLCKLNFCLRHRHYADHECKKSILNRNNLVKGNNTATSTSSNRSTVTSSAKNNVSNNPLVLTQAQDVQGNMSEDEAFARALALSMMELDDTANHSHRRETTNIETQRISVPDERHSSNKERCLLS